MTTLYHITPSENLLSIMKNGLIPAYKKGLNCGNKSTRKSVVWLTDNPTHILATQAGEEWVKRHKPVVLKVGCDGLDVKPYISHITGTSTVVPHEYYVEHTIKQHFGVEL